MRAAGVLGIGIGAVVAGVMACSGDTFTNEPGGNPDGGVGLDAGDAGRDAGGDGGGKGCAQGASERAFCSNFDKSSDVNDDKWTISGNSDGVHVRVSVPLSTTATSLPNFLAVESDRSERAYVTTSLPGTRRFKLSVDMRIVQPGNQSYVPLRLSFCPSGGGSNCFVMQLRFPAPNERDERPVYFEESGASLATQVATDSRAIEPRFGRVVLESNLDNTINGFGQVRVTFGQTSASGQMRVPDGLTRVDHIDLALGAVDATVTGGGGGGGFTPYELAYDTVIFDPEP